MKRTQSFSKRLDAIRTAPRYLCNGGLVCLLLASGLAAAGEAEIGPVLEAAKRLTLRLELKAPDVSIDYVCDRADERPDVRDRFILVSAALEKQTIKDPRGFVPSAHRGAWQFIVEKALCREKSEHGRLLMGTDSGAVIELYPRGLAEAAFVLRHMLPGEIFNMWSASHIKPSMLELVPPGRELPAFLSPPEDSLKPLPEAAQKELRAAAVETFNTLRPEIQSRLGSYLFFEAATEKSECKLFATKSTRVAQFFRADRMYAAYLHLEFDPETNTLQRASLGEWFKGE